MDKKFDLEERFVLLAANTALFCKDLPSDFTGHYYSTQLLHAAGRAALNFGEMLGITVPKDFLIRASLVLKELKESRINVKILRKIDYGNRSSKDELLDEIEQLIKIMTTLIKTKKSLIHV